jgi:hypothetical protein
LREQFGLQNVEIARCAQKLAKPADGVLDRFDALAPQQGFVDLEGGPQPPQRNAALMNAFNMQVEPSAIVVRGQMRKRVADDELKRLAGGHVRREAELRCSRPTPSLGSIECIAQIGLGPVMQTSVDKIADTLCFREQVFQSARDQFQLDLVNGFALLTRNHGTAVQCHINLYPVGGQTARLPLDFDVKHWLQVG